MYFHEKDWYLAIFSFVSIALIVLLVLIHLYVTRDLLFFCISLNAEIDMYFLPQSTVRFIYQKMKMLASSIVVSPILSTPFLNITISA